MKKFEYERHEKPFTNKQTIEKFLNDSGSLGWELVYYSERINNELKLIVCIFIFKRIIA